ncbi:putative CSL zinc finger protein [Gregarina niphandrodes]|uniref:Diphthamide biosynthesis protein 3 n=1 Tax=Gregarina niphandrodes TaxID=110365 RepID=A0A023AZD1_GRENI|nr:putative CSL zinc finger protein [Gregarina niphandrodes]EZG43838.1 putative CSL zinc finger protein [Gregarina niphandrodes]|eukprot:XP_011132993.1 putative CSL zinc finger protein [Gregarina niphandrodes]
MWMGEPETDLLYTEEEAVGFSIYKSVPLEEWEWDDSAGCYLLECPCGDAFSITKEDIAKGYRVCECPSCSLKVRIIVQ